MKYRARRHSGNKWRALYLRGATFHRNIGLFQPATTVKFCLRIKRGGVYNAANQSRMSVRESLFRGKKPHLHCGEGGGGIKKTFILLRCVLIKTQWLQTDVFAAFCSFFLGLPMTPPQTVSSLHISWRQKEWLKPITVEILNLFFFFLGIFPHALTQFQTNAAQHYKISATSLQRLMQNSSLPVLPNDDVNL